MVRKIIGPGLLGLGMVGSAFAHGGVHMHPHGSEALLLSGPGLLVLLFAATLGMLYCFKQGYFTTSENR